MLTKKSKAMTEETQQERLDRIERHVIAPILSHSCRPKWLDTEVDNDRWIVTYKPNRDSNRYVHQYKFMNCPKSKPSTYISFLLDIDMFKKNKRKQNEIQIEIGTFLYSLFYFPLFLHCFMQIGETKNTQA